MQLLTFRRFLLNWPEQARMAVISICHKQWKLKSVNFLVLMKDLFTSISRLNVLISVVYKRTGK